MCGNCHGVVGAAAIWYPCLVPCSECPANCPRMQTRFLWRWLRACSLWVANCCEELPCYLLAFLYGCLLFQAASQPAGLPQAAHCARIWANLEHSCAHDDTSAANFSTLLAAPVVRFVQFCTAMQLLAMWLTNSSCSVPEFLTRLMVGWRDNRHTASPFSRFCCLPAVWKASAAEPCNCKHQGHSPGMQMQVDTLYVIHCAFEFFRGVLFCCAPAGAAR